ncbi:hypothetical protein [Spartinivicinus ruber]|uniref:hypothetical protein n=1 Tax=Spartinivicinus ruber TaxID=2683272 RepID=UPI0013D3971F|nr:hypothetical protein [Spartinivicinus ruber]
MTTTAQSQGSYYAFLDMPNDPLLHEFTTQWVVPADLPQKNTSGGDFFLWNGIGPSSGVGLIQPVLEWRNGHWSVKTVHTTGSNYTWTPTNSQNGRGIRVSAGEVLTAFIELKQHQQNRYVYSAGFKGDKFSSTIASVTTTVPYNQLILCLEPYGTDVSEYPNQPYVEMKNINATFEGDIKSGGNWSMDSKESYKRAIPVSGSVVTDGISNGKVRFYFQ